MDAIAQRSQKLFLIWIAIGDCGAELTIETVWAIVLYRETEMSSSTLCKKCGYPPDGPSLGKCWCGPEGKENPTIRETEFLAVAIDSNGCFNWDGSLYSRNGGLLWVMKYPIGYGLLAPDEILQKRDCWVPFSICRDPLDIAESDIGRAVRDYITPHPLFRKVTP